MLSGTERWDEEKIKPILTGSNPNYSVKNIYDLAGNYEEISQLYSSDCKRRILFGSAYHTQWFDINFPGVAFKWLNYDSWLGYDNYELASSRLQLYIK